jgi:hypothetical protein
MAVDVEIMMSMAHTQFRIGPKLGQLFHWFTFFIPLIQRNTLQNTLPKIAKFKPTYYKAHYNPWYT